ncbi:hypothetical protein GCK32_017136 [Trichostrongylus colubriformis]|uniref:Uncharacterized protein n=1 Tax=Trichostrongylus colubriformis TaxID=6319 RepID=A0AAN8F9P0_TRICO
MIIVLLVCFLSELEAYSRNQQAEGPPDFTPESDGFLDQLAKDMYGYSVEEMLKMKALLYGTRPYTDEMLTTMKKVDETKGSPKLYEASIKAIGAFHALFHDKARKAKEEVVLTVKRNLTEIWWHLSEEEKKLWKEKFPYAAHIEKLANNRHIVMIGL